MKFKNYYSFLKQNTWLGLVLLLSIFISKTTQAQTSTTITTAGTSSFTVPAGVSKIVVKAWGAGGGGGGSSSSSKSGGGGGGGAYTIQTFTGLAPGTVYTNSIVVGAGGTGGAAGANSGTDGGNTTVTFTSTITANGGKLGTGGAGSSVGSGGAGGIAGTYAGGAGSIGGNGGAGGGGSAGTAIIGNAGSIGSTTAVAVTDGGPGGAGGSPLGLAPVSGPGGGGGGGDKTVGGGGTNGSGGNGFAGQVILEYFPELTLGNNIRTPGNVCAGTTNSTIHSISLTGLNNGGTITGFTFVTSGTYAAAEISNFKLYYTTTNSFSSSTLLATIASPAVAGTQTFPTFSQAIGNTTAYFWITMDVASALTDGHTLTVSSSSTSNISSSTSNIFLGGTGSASDTATLKIAPSAPTGNASQSFCSVGATTVAELIATGTSVQWYSASSGGSPLATSTTLSDGSHYYATQTVSGCENATRLDVTVGVGSTPSVPTGSASQAFCNSNSPTVASLSATGTSILWYSASSGGSPLATNTALVTSTHYYASQTASGCESTSRLDVTVTISIASSAVAGTAINTCSDAGAVNITAGSSASDYSALTWTCDGTGTFSNANSLTTCTYTPSADDITAGSRTLTLTATANPGCSDAISTKTLTITSAITVSAGGAVSDICQGGTTAALGGTFGGGATSAVWDDGGAGGSFTNNGGATPNTTTYIAAPTAPSTITLTLTATASCGTKTASKSVLVVPSVTTPSFTSGATSNRCHGVANVTYIASASNSTGLTYSLDGISAAAGNTINSSSGEVTYTANWTGTSTITASATGCNGPKMATHIVTTLAPVSTPSFIDVD